MSETPKEIPFEVFQENINRHETVIKKHIAFLIDKNVLWRSALSYRPNTATEVRPGVNKYNIYKYSISNTFYIDSLKMFTYTMQGIYYKENLTTQFDEKYIPLLNSFSMLKVDTDNAFKYLLDNNIQGKLMQAKNLHAINMDDYNIRKGRTVNRLFSRLTSISSYMHKFLLLNGEQVSEVDARSSQLMIMSLLTKNIDSKFHELVKDGEFYYSLYEELLRLPSVNINVTKDGITRRDSILMLDHSIYVSEDNYKTFKGWVYAAIFSGFKNGTTISNIIAERFKDVVDELNRQIPEGETLASYLQNTEASLFVDTAIKLNNEGFLALSKHDSLLFNHRDKEAVLGALKARYEELFGSVEGYNLFKYTERTGKKEIDINAVVTYLEDDFDEQVNKVRAEAGRAAGKEVADKTVYTFKNTETGEEFTGIKSEFSSKYVLDKKHVNKLIKGELKRVKRWILA